MRRRGDARYREPVDVAQTRVEVDTVRLLRQVLADHRHSGEMLAERRRAYRRLQVGAPSSRHRGVQMRLFEEMSAAAHLTDPALEIGESRAAGRGSRHRTDEI